MNIGTCTEAGVYPPASPHTMKPVTPDTPGRRLGKFVLFLGLALFFVYGLLPILTRSVPVLEKMAGYLDENGIDPTRYYYTDVPQVKEAELYLNEVLGDEGDR